MQDEVALAWKEWEEKDKIQVQPQQAPQVQQNVPALIVRNVVNGVLVEEKVRYNSPHYTACSLMQERATADAGRRCCAEYRSLLQAPHGDSVSTSLQMYPCTLYAWHSRQVSRLHDMLTVSCTFFTSGASEYPGRPDYAV